jgi:SAM-dependent methyltransferase
MLKLHLGCGPRVLKGWVNIDLRFEPYQGYMQYYTDKFYGEDVRGDEKDFMALDVRNGLPFGDFSVDAIFHEDFFEHLDQKEQTNLLAEAYRVLKIDGIHRINTPSLLWSLNHYKSASGISQEEWEKHGHKLLITKSYIEDIALCIGYSKVEFSSRNIEKNSIFPLEYRPDPKDRDEAGNIFVNLIK